MDAKEQCRVIMMVTPVDDNDSLFAIAQKDIKVLCAVAEKVTLVSGCIPDWVPLPSNCTVVDFNRKLHYVKQRSPLWLSIFSQLLKILYIQLRMSTEIIKLRKRTDVVFCYLGYHYLVPVTIAKICGLKVISGAWGAKREATKNYGLLLGFLLGLLLEWEYFYSDAIIVQSWNMVRENHYLSKWKQKLRLCAQYFGEEETFRTHTPISKRKKIVGFVGRFSPEKGVLEFVRSIPLVLERNSSTGFVLIGKGNLDPAVRASVEDLRISDAVTIRGFVQNELLPEYYNQFKLIVIPSESEGLPNVLLEAISCGAIVLATRVGAIPDIVEDGKTGFLLEGNSPLDLSIAILRILEMDTQLEIISGNARRKLAENYSFAKSVGQIQFILSELCGAQ